MKREEAIIELKKKITCTIGGLSEEEYNATIMAIEALSESNMIPIKLEKRYPESRDEDITDAFMRGYLKGKADRSRGEWIDKEIPCNPYPPVFCVECSKCGYRVGRETFQENTFNFCPRCGARMLKEESEVEE